MKRKFKVRFMNKYSKKRDKTHSELKKVLKRQGDISLVKWMGYPMSFNSWLDTKAMVKLTTEKSL